MFENNLGLHIIEQFLFFQELLKLLLPENIVLIIFITTLLNIISPGMTASLHWYSSSNNCEIKGFYSFCEGREPFCSINSRSLYTEVLIMRTVNREQLEQVLRKTTVIINDTKIRQIKLKILGKVSNSMAAKHTTLLNSETCYLSSNQTIEVNSWVSRWNAFIFWRQ